MKTLGLILFLVSASAWAQEIDLVRWQQLFRSPQTVPATPLEKAFLLVRVAIEEENHDSTAARAAVDEARRRPINGQDAPLHLVLEATGRAVIARNSSNILEQLTEITQALFLYDRSVELSRGTKTEWVTRLFRGSAYLYLPDFFQKQQVSQDDLASVAATLQKEEALKSLDPVVLFYLGEHEGRLHHDAEAHRLWQQVLAEAATYDIPASIYEVRKSKDRLGED